MIDAKNALYATLILRIGLGVLSLAQAVQKLCVSKMASKTSAGADYGDPRSTPRPSIATDETSHTRLGT
jgi:hypothetical protein